jgi:hypothetical protein
LLDPQQHALRVDVGHLQRGDLRHAQARTVGGAKMRLTPKISIRSRHSRRTVPIRRSA